MGNLNFCQDTDNIHQSSNLQLDKEKEDKVVLIQNEWRKKRKERDEIIARIRIVDGNTSSMGTIVNKEEIDKRTSNEILKIERTLPIYHGQKEDTINIEGSLIMRKPFKYSLDNSIYHGFWNSNGLREGYGIFLSEDDIKYEGLWRNGQLFKGRIFENDGTYYEGQIKNFNAEGKGTKYMSNGDVYSGQWSNGSQIQNGSRKYSNGDIYEGAFLNNIVHGNGKYTWSDGSMYEGEFERGVINGKGVYTTSKGDTYKGMWKENLPNGEGTYKSGNIVYTGQYVSGKKSGRGLLKFPSGSYEGEWSNNKPEGQGIFKDKTRVISGIWRYGKLISADNQDAYKYNLEVIELDEGFKTDKDFTKLTSTIKRKRTSLFKPLEKELFIHLMNNNLKENA